MHFSNVFALALPVIALATAIPRGGGNHNTGPMQCCEQVQDASDFGEGFFESVGLHSVAGLVGLNCNPIVDLGPMACHSRPVCCSDNGLESLISIGCVFVEVDL